MQFHGSNGSLMGTWLSNADCPSNRRFHNFSVFGFNTVRAYAKSGVIKLIFITVYLGKIISSFWLGFLFLLLVSKGEF
ncbi:hypothetical protein T4D_15808 [Trichinella pseudospiralis]|uniref:Uncharacterized protein n=1 Tax=Trichinella pseudospiralis TaxID=6337 RepID=A0A0V1F822_TRIPS|nr:hypothetical protein T4D_15808 [Trichinella pseudospiralis]